MNEQALNVMISFAHFLASSSSPANFHGSGHVANGGVAPAFLPRRQPEGHASSVIVKTNVPDGEMVPILFGVTKAFVNLKRTLSASDYLEQRYNEDNEHEDSTKVKSMSMPSVPLIGNHDDLVFSQLDFG